MKYDRVVAVKSTIFGLDISQDQTGKPHLRFGLVRDFVLIIPTSTNELHTAPFTTHTDADIGVAKQSVTEDCSSIQKP